MILMLKYRPNLFIIKVPYSFILFNLIHLLLLNNMSFLDQRKYHFNLNIYKRLCYQVIEARLKMFIIQFQIKKNRNFFF